MRRRFALWMVPALFLLGCGSGRVVVPKHQPSAEYDGAAAEAAFRNSRTGGVPASKGKAISPDEMVRYLVRRGSLSLRVSSLDDAEAKLKQVAAQFRATVDSSNGSGLASASPSLSVTLRVPVGSFDALIPAVEKLGTRLEKSVSTEDVTGQIVDFDARLKTLRVQEQTYLGILSGAKKVSDVLQITDSLTGVRTEIEQIVGQRKQLADQASRSTLEVQLYQANKPNAPVGDPDWASEAWANSVGSLKNFGRGIATFVIWLAAFTPIWLTGILVLVFLIRRANLPKA